MPGTGSPFISAGPSGRRNPFFGRDPIFADRRDAGRQLARTLDHLKSDHPLILALPRGGVPVAYEVAEALDAELDVLLVRKLGAPGHPELGVGAVVDGHDPRTVLNESVLNEVRPSREYLEAEIARQLVEIERRRTAYRGNREAADPHGRTVIVVDDGIATGGTVRAALQALRQAGPKRLVLATPVAPRDSLGMLSTEADEIVCLASPDPFYAVGLYFADFNQTTDEEVVELLARRRKLEPKR